MTEFEAQIIAQGDEHLAHPGKLFRRAPGLYYWVDPATLREWCIERGGPGTPGWSGEWLASETRIGGAYLDPQPTLAAVKEALGIA
jgi:hypothetical protein